MKLGNLWQLKLFLLIAMLSTNLYSKTTYIDTSTSEATTSRPTIETVTPTPQEDKIITQSIKRHIRNSKVLSRLNISVQTYQGVVAISGSVESDSEASSIIELAQSIVGVIDVQAGNLHIRDSQQPFIDMLTTAKAKGLLVREDIFGTKDIASVDMSVETKDGVVYLTGAVKNQAQINNAIKLIEGIKDVSKVEYKFQKVTPTSASSDDSKPNNSVSYD